MMFDKKLVVKHWFLKQNMPVDFFLSNENFEMSKWVRKWDGFFSFFIEWLKAWFHAPVLPIISDFIEKKMLSYCWESQPKLFKNSNLCFNEN